MNQLHHKNLMNHANGNNTVLRMTLALKESFQLNQNIAHSICIDQSHTNLDAALIHWLNSILICPDHQLGLLLMPFIAQRFDEYLTKIKRN